MVSSLASEKVREVREVRGVGEARENGENIVYIKTLQPISNTRHVFITFTA
jgi:hypothetical protein